MKIMFVEYVYIDVAVNYYVGPYIVIKNCEPRAYDGTLVGGDTLTIAFYMYLLNNSYVVVGTH